MHVTCSLSGSTVIVAMKNLPVLLSVDENMIRDLLHSPTWAIDWDAMEILIRMTSELDIHSSENHFWPPDVPLALPAIGDGVVMLGHGTRTLKSRTFNYDSTGTGRDKRINRLTVDLLCE
jgi:hypothetical protein